VGDADDCIRVVGEEVPGVAAGFNDIVTGVEDGDGEVVGAEEGPDVLDGVQVRAASSRVESVCVRQWMSA